MNNAKGMERRIRELEIQIRALAAYAVETRTQGIAHRSLGPDFVHGGKYVKGHPTKTQMELARKGASGLLDSAVALAELAIDFGDETVV